MASLFSSPKLPPPPKPVRMPNETDPEVQAAGMRARENALRRSGRLSTIMTDQTRETTGSSGQKLGV
jgi:hypothetical protein